MTVTPMHCSDHHFLSFTFSLTALPINASPLGSSFSRRNLHSISHSSLASTILTTLPHPDSFLSLSLDTATDKLLSSLSSAVNLLSPLSSRPARSSPPAPWLTEVLRSNRKELRKAERKWRRKWRKSQLDSDLHSYQALLYKFSTEVTAAKSSFYKEKLEESASDPRWLFRIFSSLLKPPSPPPSSSLTPEDFVTFFEEKVNKIHEVLQLLKSSNPTTCPLDPIPSTLFQTVSMDLLPFITFIMNSMMTRSHQARSQLHSRLPEWSQF
ncbi:uncharacterized protein LOC143482216 isoform X2 [Brachyhypopomus gauderio]|uniref:uncharacterized protein LOC143482216 isoform X2 n=1 Tax=Brachyhypopomus gauderio TaxID=698409 RepID=UPI004041D670